MELTTICKNCGNTFTGNFCNNCGQAAHLPELSLHFVWHEIQHGIFHFDNGIFYSIKQLLTRPGHTAREFINGKRVHHFKPLSLIVVLATFYGILFHFFINTTPEVKLETTAGNIVNVYEHLNRWYLDHFAYISLMLTLIATITSYYVFKKQGYNLVEHLILNAFYVSLILVVTLLIFPLLYFFAGGEKENLKNYLLFIQNIYFILMCWCYIQFFNKTPKLKTFGLTALAYFMMSIVGIVIAYISILIANAIYQP